MAHKKTRKPAPSFAAVEQAAAPYRPFLDPGSFQLLLDAARTPQPQSVRVNPLKIDANLARQTWPEWYGWKTLPIPFCPNGFQVIEAQRRPSQTIEFKLGYFYLQDAASMLPVELFHFDPQSAPLVLDLAAAPGGKTTHLVSRTLDLGLVIANDSSASRVNMLRAVLQDWGAINTAVVNYSGENFGRWYKGVFDRVLLDAPCSMENLSHTESRPDRTITDREHRSLAGRQFSLLESALRAVKPGGEIVYATCTLAPLEDEGVLDALLRRYPGKLTVEAISPALLPVPAPALSAAGEQTFLPEVQHALRLWPHLYQTTGFFTALLRKVDELDGERDFPPDRPFEKTGLVRLSGPEVDRLAATIEEKYGWNPAPIIEGQRLGLWQRGSDLFAIPEAFTSQFAGLPYAGLGMLWGEWEEGGFTPSHELVARFGLDFVHALVCLPEDGVPGWFSGADWFDLAGVSASLGSVVVVTDRLGRNLGRGKVLRDRIKNQLPRRLVFA